MEEEHIFRYKGSLRYGLIPEGLPKDRNFRARSWDRF